MPNYLCMQRTIPVEQPEGHTPPSPAEMQEKMQEMYAKFGAWQEKFKDQLVDPGGKLGDGKLVATAAPDGPFVEVKELIGGYMIVSADDLEGAIAVAQACPGLVRPGSGVEVVEIKTS